MLGRYYKTKSFVYEKICQVDDSINHALLHPYLSMRKLAHENTVLFILENCPKSIPCRSPRRLMDVALEAVSVEGAFLEFGVFRGASVNYIAAKNRTKDIHGFDSFEGLKEPWAIHPKNAYTLNGKLPKARNNVCLYKGDFSKTWPEWLDRNNEKIAFLHVDCDLYSSTETIFEYLGERLQPGTVILFDDYFNFPGWEDDAHRVLTNFSRQKNLHYDFLGYSFKELAIRVTSIDK
jgi:hypothetical protein